MGIFARLKMGWSLSMDSLQVLREHPQLALFPLVSGVAGIVYIGLLFGGSFVLGLFEGDVSYAVLFLLYLGSAFIAAFFNAGLVHEARLAFRGETPTLKGGLAEAWRHKGPLFAWAVISAIVGMVIRAIEQQDSIVADIVAFVFSAAWSIITYFIIPVIVFEDESITGMFKRSGQTFKNTWGETAGATFGVGLVSVVFTIIGLAFAAIVFFALGGLGSGIGFFVAIAIAGIVLLAVFLLSSALGAVAKTALYVYATEGKRPSGFENVDFQRGAR